MIHLEKVQKNPFFSPEKSTKSTTFSPSPEVKEKFMKEEENRLEEPLSVASMTTLNTHGGAWTNRNEMWILEDKRLLFTTLSDELTTEWIEVFEQIMNE